MTTTEDLPKRLFEIIKAKGGHPRAWEIGSIVARAQTGYYHDFRSDLEMPKRQLAQDLFEVGLNKVAKDVINGMYDEHDP